MSNTNAAKAIKIPDARLTVLATEIKEKLTLARRHGQATLSALMDAGDRLLEAKQALDHGEWDDWLSANFALSDRTARLYMQLAQHRPRVEARMATVATLGIRGALEQIYEDQMQEGREKRNRELLAGIGLPKPIPDHQKTDRTRYLPAPPSELEKALSAVLLHVKLKREWLARFGLVEKFDAELRQGLELVNQSLPPPPQR